MSEDIKEESLIDMNFDSISEINTKNTSFYSIIDPTEVKTYPSNNMNHYINDNPKPKYDYKIDMESVRMLPIFLEKVTQNIQSIDNLINKQKSICNSRTNSKEKTTNNTSGCHTISEQLHDIANIQNIVKKSVEGVNEILNNKKLSISSGATGSGNINNCGTTQNINVNINNNQIPSTIEKPQTMSLNLEKININITNNTTSSGTNFQTISNNQTSQNFAIIEERDEDLFSRNSNIINEAPVPKKKNLSSINKASFAGGVKKFPNNNAGNNSSIIASNSTPKKSLIEVPKSKIGLKKGNTSNTANKSTASNNFLSNSTQNKKTFTTNTMSTINSHTTKKQKLNSPKSIKTTPDSSTCLPKKKNLLLTSMELSSRHKKTTSVSYAFGNENYMTGKKSKRNLLISDYSDNNNKDKTKDPKRSTENLRNLSSINLKKPLKSQNTKKSLTKSITSKNTCSCKCHLLGKKSLTLNNSKFNKKISYTNYSTNQSNNFNLRVINKINEVNDINANNMVELFYIYNEISSINAINQKAQQQITKSGQSDLLRTLKNFLDSNEEEGEILFNTNIDNSSNSNSLLSISFDKKRSELNKRREEKKNSKVIYIQRKWREYRVKKILFPMISLGLTFNQVENFSLFSCNKNEIIKMCKLHLYSSMLKFSEKFKCVISLMHQANSIWKELTKNNQFMSIENFIKDIVSLNEGYSNHHSMNNITMSYFISSISKILTRDIRLHSNSITNKDEEKNILKHIKSMTKTNSGSCSSLTRNKSGPRIKGYYTSK